MNDSFINLIVTLPFAGWYGYKYLQFRELKKSGIPAKAIIARKLGTTVQYRYKDVLNTEHKQQMRLGKTLGDTVNNGDTLDIVHDARVTGTSCPVAMLDTCIKQSKMFYIGASVFALFFLLAVLLEP